VQDSGARRRRDAAFLAIAYGSGVRRAEAIALDLADLDFTAGQLRVRQGKGKKPRQAPLAPSAQPALEDWLQVRGRDPGPLFCAVSKTGRLAREGAGGLRRLSGSAAWAICKERGRNSEAVPPTSRCYVQTGWPCAWSCMTALTGGSWTGRPSRLLTSSRSNRLASLGRQTATTSSSPAALIGL
jgi:integrase-like protein